ncbi:MAG: hypothetical protein CRN43_09700 [Candidatus Nephrothrix sp. EaCA]|nr:MAG: hypothetical protein CRN43_09700 [Candidatus Nephrothrix sp. EaCA]
MAGKIAPSKFPKCGRPVLCIPVRIRFIMATKVNTKSMEFYNGLNFIFFLFVKVRQMEKCLLILR